MEMICCRSCGKAIRSGNKFEPYCDKCKSARDKRRRVFGSMPIMETELEEEDESEVNPREAALNAAMGSIKFEEEEEDDLSL